MPAAVPQTPRFCLTDPPHTHRAGRPVRLGSRLEPVPHAALDNQRLSPRGLSLGGADANPVSPTEVRQQGPGRTGGRPGTAGGGPPICPQPLALGQPWTRPGVPGLGDVPGGVRPPQVSPVVELAWRAQGGGRPREREIHRGIFRSPLWSFRPPVSKRSTTPPKARSSTPPPGDSSGNGGGGGDPQPLWAGPLPGLCPAELRGQVCPLQRPAPTPGGANAHPGVWVARTVPTRGRGRGAAGFGLSLPGRSVETAARGNGPGRPAGPSCRGHPWALRGGLGRVAGPLLTSGLLSRVDRPDCGWPWVGSGPGWSLRGFQLHAPARPPPQENEEECDSEPRGVRGCPVTAGGPELDRLWPEDLPVPARQSGPVGSQTGVPCTPSRWHSEAVTVSSVGPRFPSSLGNRSAVSDLEANLSTSYTNPQAPARAPPLSRRCCPARPRGGGCPGLAGGRLQSGGMRGGCWVGPPALGRSAFLPLPANKTFVPRRGLLPGVIYGLITKFSGGMDFLNTIYIWGRSITVRLLPGI